MEIQHVSNNGQVQSFDDPDKFLEQIDTLLKLGYKFSVSVAKESIDLFEQLNQLFEKHKIELVITTDSDPGAAEYLIMALGGAIAGGVGGAAVSAIAWTVVRQIAIRTAAFAVPGIGPVIAVGATLGALIGMIAGLAVTKMGLRVRFSPKTPNVLEIDLIPEST